LASISALFQIENGDYAAAEREYREAIALDSSVPYVYDNLALLLHCLSRRGEAEAAYGKARDVYDASAQALWVRATQWDTAGLSKDAQQARDRALVSKRTRPRCSMPGERCWPPPATQSRQL
jgi:Flp pilus assembly protein TadD